MPLFIAIPCADWYRKRKRTLYRNNEKGLRVKITEHIYYYQERGMLDCNTYIIQGAKTVAVDVGLDRYIGALLREMEQDGIDPASVDYIVNTHLHLDHTAGNTEFKKKSGAVILMAQVQKEHYSVSVKDTSRFFGLEPVDFQEDGTLVTPLLLGSLTLEVIDTPGHSPDSVCFYCPEKKFLISGDLLFDHNTGRSDLPGGKGELLKKSIERISDLDVDVLLPGHMGILAEARYVQQNLQFVRENVFQWL